MRNIIFLLFLMISIFKLNAQSLSKIVSDIAKVNVIQDETVSYTFDESENYKNYKKLQSKATFEELIKLTKHENGVVNAYSIFALIDKDYKDIRTIYSNFIEIDKIVETEKGCLVGDSNLSSEIYHYYWNSLDSEKRENDALLMKLDSITLYKENAYWLLHLRALENRLYSKSYNPQIEYLAFKKNNRDAMTYLLNWYKADYKDELKKSLLDYLINTNFQDVGVTPYYETVNELFKFRDETIKEKIIEKMKQDKFWEHSKLQFVTLLNENGIYEFRTY